MAANVPRRPGFDHAAPEFALCQAMNGGNVRILPVNPETNILFAPENGWL